MPEGFVAALALGAEGISMGSRFIVTREAPVPHHVKEYLVSKTEEDTVVTDNLTGFAAGSSRTGSPRTSWKWPRKRPTPGK